MGTIQLLFLVVFSTITDCWSRILVTQYSDLVHWTCFGTSSSTDCCKEIGEAATKLDIPNHPSCDHLLAEIPDVPKLLDYDMAQYSLIWHYGNAGVVQSTQQYRWKDSILTKQPSPTSPFFWNVVGTLDQSIEFQSVLSQDGGMHREMTSTFENLLDFESYFMFMTVPESMFVDLDDFITDSTLSLHAAKVCDIEKPAFVSGQHVIVVEGINNSSLTQKTKWHIRYPAPSQNGADFIRNLPEPQAVFIKHRKLRHSTQFAKLPDVSVAAGYKQDGNFVMLVTLISCWIGVLKMLKDISAVSYWDT